MINSKGGHAVAIQADISQDKEVRGMVDQLVQQFETIDLLVNKAGIIRHIPFDDLEAATEEVWDDLYSVNVKEMYLCARAVFPTRRRINRARLLMLAVSRVKQD